MLVALELQNGVDNVLQYLWSGYASFLIDMSDQDNGRVGLLGKFKDGGGTFAHLHQASGRRLDCLG